MSGDSRSGGPALSEHNLAALRARGIAVPSYRRTEPTAAIAHSGLGAMMRNPLAPERREQALGVLAGAQTRRFHHIVGL